MTVIYDRRDRPAAAHRMAKWARTVVRVAVALWLLYLVAGALFTFTPIGQSIIAPHPERCSVTWDLAWTIIPGIAHVRGLEVKQHTRDVLWSLHVDRATTGVNLFALPFKTFHAILPRATGVTTTLKKAPTNLPPRDTKKTGFRLLFQGISAKDIRSVDLHAVHIDGDGFTVRGTLDTTARGPFGIPRAKVTLEGGRVVYGGQSVVTDLKLDAKARIEKHNKDEIPETGFLTLTSGRVEVEGDTAELKFLDAILRSVPWMNVHGGEGHVHGTIGLDHGSVAPDSHLEVDTSAFTFGFLNYVATGQGVLSIDGVPPDGSGTDTDLVFELTDFDVRFTDSDTSHLKGKGLRAEVVGHLTEMLGPGAAVAVTIDLPECDVPDLTVYNRYLKAGEAVEILSGAGRIASHLEASTATNQGHGSIDLQAQAVLLNIEDRPIVSDVTSNSVFVARDLKKHHFALDGTKIRLDNARVGTPEETPQEIEEQQEGWWCDLEITNGVLRFGKPVELDLDATLTARDAAPALAMMAKTQKSEKRLDKLLGIRDMAGSARVVVRDGSTGLLDVHAEGGRAELLGNLCMSQGNRRGLFYIRYGILSLTTEIDGVQEKKHMTGPRKYFVKKAADFSCAGVKPKPVEAKTD